LSVDAQWKYGARVPYIGGGVDVLDRLCDLRSNAVTLDERDCVLALAAPAR
jgi:hypothetical protein